MQHIALFDKCKNFTRAREVQAAGLYPYFKPITRSEDTVVVIEGQERIMMGSNNYLGLTHHPEVLAAAKGALERYGPGCTGSRFLNGTLDLHEQLEAELAEYFGKEACLIFSTGYQANLRLISGLVGRGDVVFLDKLDHASIVDGATMSHGETVRFNHGDLAGLERKLQHVPTSTGMMIIVDGVFSMEGDIADVPNLLKVAQKYGAALALARIRDRADRDADCPRVDRTAREDIPVLAQAVRCGRVHEPRGAPGRAAVAVPPADQLDGDPHLPTDRPGPRDVRPARQRAGGHLSAVEIVPVHDGRGLERFIAFPYDLYRGHPLWVPQLRMDVRTLLSPKKNPFFQHAEVQCFVGRLDGRIVGRIAAIKNDAHNREHGDRVGFYGFFESVDDPAVARALFDTAAAWLRQKGFETMRGPMNPSVNDDCCLLV